MDEVRNLTAIAANKSSAVSQEAIDLLILDLTLPLVDIEQLRQQVESVNNEVSYNITLYRLALFSLQKVNHLNLIYYIFMIY